MNDKQWNSPATVIALLGLIVSIGANIYQYSTSSQRLNFEKQKWLEEKIRLENEFSLKIEEFERKKSIGKELQEELIQVKKNIGVWENSLIQDKAELMIMENQLSQMKDGPMKQALQQNLQLQKNMIATKEEELKKSISRRNEIEQLR